MIVIGVGGCGVALTADFFDVVDEQRASFSRTSTSSPHPLFDYTNAPRLKAVKNRKVQNRGKPRCILVDTEPRMIDRVIAQNRTVSRMDRSNQIVATTSISSCGNNWASGYFGLKQSIVHQVIKSVRQEAERCESFESILIIHSLCGGTGGGLGSRIIEEIRDMYPSIRIFSVAIGSDGFSNTSLQHYNVLFSLDRLQECCDGILHFRNEDISNQLTVSSKKADKSFTMEDINQYIAVCIAGVFLPTRQSHSTVTATAASSDTQQHRWESKLFPPRLSAFDANEFCSTVVPLSTAKFLRVHSVSSNKKRDPTWEELATSLCQSFPSPYIIESEYNQEFKWTPNILAYDFWIRGLSANSLLKNKYIKMDRRIPPNQNNEVNLYLNERETIRREVVNTFQPLSWQENSGAGLISPGHSSFSLFRRGTNEIFPKVKSATLCLNQPCIAALFEKTSIRAESMYNSKAYWHWYSKCGADEMFFNETLRNVKAIVSNYKELQ
eukprot:g93.t1